MKINYSLMLLIALFLTFTSCATLFSGEITQYQKTKPKQGEQQRKVRIVPLVADIILFWPSLIVDFSTGAIYKPKETNPIKKESKKERIY